MVTLSDKDADFIAAYLRKEVEHETSSYDEVIEKGNKVLRLAELLGVNNDSDEIHRHLEDAKNLHGERMAFFTTALELLMCGSRMETAN